jgi:hypothetical protein
MALRENIMQQIRTRGPKLTELLQNEDLSRNHSQVEIKQMLLRLLQDGEIELSSDMKLGVVDEAA